MSIPSRVRWHYRQKGLGGLLTAALRNPTAAVSALADSESHFYSLELPVFREDVLTVVRPLVDADDATLVETWRELESGELRAGIEANLASTADRPDSLHSNWRELLYTVVRLTEPSVVVETGVYDGLSSAYVLQALERNGSGRLYSLDINDTSRLPRDIDGMQAGWLVPPALRDHWDLQFGDSKDLLPAVTDEVDVDLFLHDSLHTAEHMYFEFEIVIESMGPGAVFMADNVRLNDIFWKFSRSHLDAPVFWKNTELVRPNDETVVDDRIGAGVVSSDGSIESAEVGGIGC